VPAPQANQRLGMAWRPVRVRRFRARGALLRGGLQERVLPAKVLAG
jgi:hypothetical protein